MSNTTHLPRLLRRLRAFERQLGNFTDYEPSSAADTEYHSLLGALADRYTALTSELMSVDNISFNDLVEDFRPTSTRELRPIQLEVGYAADVLEGIIEDTKELRVDFDPSNSVFSEGEIRDIHRHLDDLQTSLAGLASRSQLDNGIQTLLLNSVLDTVNELKNDSKGLGRKDWKNHLVQAFMSLILLFAFSQEARTTIYTNFFLLYGITKEQVVMPGMIPAPPPRGPQIGPADEEEDEA